MYDLLIKKGRIVDGSGNPWYCADVGVNGGSIAAIGRIEEKADRVIDAEGLYVSPGIHRRALPRRLHRARPGQPTGFQAPAGHHDGVRGAMRRVGGPRQPRHPGPAQGLRRLRVAGGRRALLALAHLRRVPAGAREFRHSHQLRADGGARHGAHRRDGLREPPAPRRRALPDEGHRPRSDGGRGPSASRWASPMRRGTMPPTTRSSSSRRSRRSTGASSAPTCATTATASSNRSRRASRSGARRSCRSSSPISESRVRRTPARSARCWTRSRKLGKRGWKWRPTSTPSRRARPCACCCRTG